HIQRTPRPCVRRAPAERFGRGRSHSGRALPDGVPAAPVRRRPRRRSDLRPQGNRDGGPPAGPRRRTGEPMKQEPGTGKYEGLLERCRSLAAIPTAVAHPCEESALLGALEAGQKGLIEPILVGPEAKIREVA